MSFQVYQAQGLRIFSGDTATCAGYTGNAGEISVNTETKAVYVHDGITAGGTPLTTASEAEMLGMTLGQLANVYLTSQSDKSLLSFDLDSDSWKSIEGLKVSDLLDMAVNTPSEGDLLAYDGATQKWKNVPASTGGAGATNLTGLDDVNLVSPANNQVLSYNSSTSKWENKAGGGGGGAGLPKIDYGNYTLTMDGEFDQELSPDGTAVFYTSSGTTNPVFNKKENSFDWENDNSDIFMISWRFDLQKWVLIRGADFMTEGSAAARYYNRNSLYTKTEVDDAIAGASGGGAPIGTVIVWTRPNRFYEIPDGWLQCNGAEINQSLYSDLFNVYGYTFCATKMQDYMGNVMNTEEDCRSYQEDNFSETDRTFCLPDYRNQVLIGADHQTANNFHYDPDLGPADPWAAGLDSHPWSTMPLTWNETVTGPTYTDYSQPWLYGPYGLTKPLMPDGRFVTYIVRAK